MAVATASQQQIQAALQQSLFLRCSRVQYTVYIREKKIRQRGSVVAISGLGSAPRLYKRMAIVVAPWHLVDFQRTVHSSSMARGLYFSVGLLVAVMVAISAAQDVPMVMPVEAEPQPVVETVIPVVAEEPGVDGEQRPKRQFLAGLLIGSLIGHGHHHHHHGYGYGHGYGHGYHRTPYYGGGYRYGYPYYG